MSVQLQGHQALRKPKHRASVPIHLVVTYAALILVSCLFLVPLVWMLSTSVKPAIEAFRIPPTLIPQNWAWSNYSSAVNDIPFLLYTCNTLFISAMAVLGQILASSAVAYSLAKIDWGGRKVILPLLLCTMLIPYQVTLIPTYKIWYSLHATGSFLPLILPNFFGSAFYIFMLRQFISNIPNATLDSARIDGAGEVRIWAQIVLPLMRSALMAVGILTFLANWSDFLGPLIYLGSQEHWTLSLGLQQFVNQHDVQWGALMAASGIFTVPIIIIFFIGQSYIIEGVTLTGYK